MTNNTQQLEKEVEELRENGFSDHSAIPVNALETACLILDNKFGKDFHKKNPKLAIRFAESLLMNTMIKDIKEAIQNGLGETLDSIYGATQQKDFKVKEIMFEDYADSFRF